MQAVILAAGEGTRLRPLTLETPKPLLKIGGKTIIDRILEALPEDIDEIVMVVDYLEDKIKAYLGENFLGRKIIYAKQREKKGTYGALWSAREELRDKFLVINGDDLHSKEELSRFISEERTFGIQKMRMPNYYAVIVNKEGYIEGFDKDKREEEKFVATGVYLLDREIFKHEGILVYGGEYGLPQTILSQKDDLPIKAVVTQEWIPINSINDIERAEKLC